MNCVDVVTLMPEVASEMCRFCMTLISPTQAKFCLDWSADGPNADVRQLLEKLIDQQIPESPHLPTQFCSTCHVWLKKANANILRFKEVADMWLGYLRIHHTIIKQQISEDEFKEDSHQFNDEIQVEYLEIEMCSVLDEMKEEYIEHDYLADEIHETMVDDTVIGADCGNDRTLLDDDSKVFSTSGKDLVEWSIPSHWNSNDAPVECDICGESICNKSTFNKHLTKEHDLHRRYSCQFCPKMFQTRVRFRMHSKTHPQPKSFKCCGMVFDNKPDLRDHQKIHDKAQTCHICSKVFKNKLRLSLHVKRHGERTIPCDKCHMFFRLTKDLKKHVTNVHSPKQFFCEKCGLRLSQKKLLNVHQKRGCNERLNTDLPDKVVVRSTLQCSSCEFKCLRIESLRRHMARHHPEYDWKAIASCLCMKCIRQFDSPEQVAEHQAKHPVYQCDICKMILITQLSLERHVKIHSTKDRPFTCEICLGTYRSRHQLKSHHRRRHTNERPFACPSCDRCYAERYEMNDHIKAVHNSGVRHHCSECTLSFSTAKYLAMHVSRVHTGNFKYYQCPTCDWNCTNSQSLTSHQAVNHPILSD